MTYKQLALLEFAGWFLYRLDVPVNREFVIGFRRKRMSLCSGIPGYYFKYDRELKKVMPDSHRGWKNKITREE